MINDAGESQLSATEAPELPRDILFKAGSSDNESVLVEAIGRGWLVTHRKSHCTLGTKIEREVFLDAHDMMMWVLEHLSSYHPEKKNG